MSASSFESDRATPGKYLTFALNGETLGVPLLLVREIIAMHPITSLPRLPKHVKGVINLRGRIIPIIDLRLRLGMPEASYDAHTCIIVIDADWLPEEEHAPVGCIVDTVDEVFHVTRELLEPPPQLGVGDEGQVAMGMAKHPQRKAVITLLDMSRVLDRLDRDIGEIPAVDAAQAAATAP